jgi:hypothetical protein
VIQLAILSICLRTLPVMNRTISPACLANFIADGHIDNDIYSFEVKIKDTESLYKLRMGLSAGYRAVIIKEYS